MLRSRLGGLFPKDDAFEARHDESADPPPGGKVAFDGAEASPERGGFDADGEVLVNLRGEFVEGAGDRHVVESQDIQGAADGGAGRIKRLLEPGLEAVLLHVLD